MKKLNTIYTRNLSAILLNCCNKIWKEKRNQALDPILEIQFQIEILSNISYIAITKKGNFFCRYDVIVERIRLHVFFTEQCVFLLTCRWRSATWSVRISLSLRRLEFSFSSVVTCDSVVTSCILVELLVDSIAELSASCFLIWWMRRRKKGEFNKIELIKSRP